MGELEKLCGGNQEPYWIMIKTM